MPVPVVNDIPINRKVAGALLTCLGGAIEYAEIGQIAPSTSRHARFGLVLMDCQMPGMDGYLPKPLSLQNLRVRLKAAAPRSAPAS